MQLSYGSKPIGCGTYALRWCDGFWKALAIVCCHCAFGMASEMGDVEQQGGNNTINNQSNNLLHGIVKKKSMCWLLVAGC